jgi:hypothetical protein
MNTKKIILFGFMLVLLGSCVNYLDPYPNSDRDGEQLWNYAGSVQGLVGAAYDNINGNRNYNDNEGVYLEGATDNAVVTSTTNNMRRLAVNSLTTGMDPFQTYWDRDYKAIYLVNLFLKDRRGYNTRFLVNAHFNDMLRKQLEGEAFALRAWFYWDLLQKFGGKGTDGNMLGVPLLLDPSDVTAENNFSRNTYDECVAQIIADCDSAWKYLPIAHRDFLVADPNDLSYAGGKYWGRFDGISTRAIKALVYLTWASPRFNPGNDIARWDSAAFNAKKVMDFKMTKDNVAGGFVQSSGTYWTEPNSPEIIMTTRYNSSNDAIERILYPGGFSGTGEVGPTQDLVDAFPMANGYPITDLVNSGYNPLTPYAGRDARFYATIFYNTALFKQNNTSTTWYTFEAWDNAQPAIGKDAAGTKSTNTRTNYYIKKFVAMGLNLSATSPSRQSHSKFLIRYSHMVLAFAEAANQVVGPTDAAKYGMSARTALQYLRSRKSDFNYYTSTLAAPPAAPDAYLAAVAASGTVAFDALVRNERRIETCFEGNRFFDLRRWTTDLTEINKPVHGAAITKNADLSYTYNMTWEVEQRIFTSAYWPIPYQEMLRMNNMVQNEGWESWN